MKKEIIKIFTEKFNNLLLLSFDNFNKVINNKIKENNNKICNLFNEKINQIKD